MQSTVDLSQGSQGFSPSHEPNGSTENNRNEINGALNPSSECGSRTDSVPVFVMLPLDTINADGVFRYASSRWFNSALQELKATGIHGVAVDVWWGAVERRPRHYDWSGYRQLFDLISSLGLRLQVVLAFHACGGNVGDNAEVPLPPWVIAAGERDPDIFFTDRPRELSPGRRNRECISLFAEEEPGLLKGRSAVQCYADFMRSFRDEFSSELGGFIEEVIVGCGPCGELRYPSYPEPNGWRFPGIGEFQCYDRRALASLARAASVVGRSEWGNAGPHDAGTYNSSPEETAFFQGWNGRWDSDYGRFFLSWYSNALMEHGERMLKIAGLVFNVSRVHTSKTKSQDLDLDVDLCLDEVEASLSPVSPSSGSAGMAIDENGVGSPNNNTTNNTTTNDPRSDNGMGGEINTTTTTTTGAAPLMPSPSPSPSPFSPSYPPPPPPLLTSTKNGGWVLPPAGTAGAASNTSLDSLSNAAGTAGLARSSSGPSSSTTTNGTGNGLNSAPGSITGPPMAGLPSRPSSYASFKSSSISEGLNALEDWSWPSPSGPPVQITLKIAGIHWWYRTRSHAAELTAGYFNCEGHGGYDPIISLCTKHGAALTLTCVEMCDSQHPPEALCGPEGLLRQVREAAAAAGVPVGGENALPCFMPNAIDEIALHRVVYNTQPWGTPLQQGGGGSAATDQGRGPPGLSGGYMKSSTGVSSQNRAVGSLEGGGQLPRRGSSDGGNDMVVVAGMGTPRHQARLPPMRTFTFLRLTPEMMSPSYQDQWRRFMKLMFRNGQRFRTSSSWMQNMGFQ